MTKCSKNILAFALFSFKKLKFLHFLNFHVSEFACNIKEFCSEIEILRLDFQVGLVWSTHWISGLNFESIPIAFSWNFVRRNIPPRVSIIQSILKPSLLYQVFRCSSPSLKCAAIIHGITRKCDNKRYPPILSHCIIIVCLFVLIDLCLQICNSIISFGHLLWWKHWPFSALLSHCSFYLCLLRFSCHFLQSQTSNKYLIFWEWFIFKNKGFYNIWSLALNIPLWVLDKMIVL